MAGDLSGGAARGAYWLHQGLRQLGVDSVLLGQSFDEEADPSVRSLVRSKDQEVKLKVSRRLGGIGKLFYPRRTDRIFSTGFGGVDFTNHPSFRAADIVHLHWIRDDARLRSAYSAADVFVAPSRMEAFGKTVAESMSCGTPVVCFNSTGPADIVSHLITGYKAKAFDIEDLARGISWVLNLSLQDKHSVRKMAREHVVEHFATNVIAAEYIALYKQILGTSESHAF
ncbi:glycosyltransferase [Roseobacter sp. AzwK-3b]|uniref:glycosyltransferase n=1 Tax=Roseobacter sp. AzwK-3b TaxID=351016 RepID=UPI0018DC1791|nr:glycosyltransferase [Roseobacter sp. AzwK-3b]